jgi:DNA primase
MIQDEVLAIAEEYLENIRKSGVDGIKASCPFHPTDDPRGYSITFSMSLSRGVFFCFSCHKAGNLYQFLKFIGEGHAHINRKYGLLVTELNKQNYSSSRNKKLVLTKNPAIPEHLLGLFDYCPLPLVEKGFSEDTLKHFEVGYDTWHERITYPLRDIEGKLVGVSGRSVDYWNRPRYKTYDSNEYKTWDMHYHAPNKGLLLWNIHNVYPEAMLTPPAPTIVVEGFKACMWVYQTGFTRVVATMGNLISRAQIQILERMSSSVVLLFDGNEAGIGGTERAGRMMLNSMCVRVVPLPEDAQPDDLSKEQLTEAIKHSTPFGTWLVRKKR